MSLKEVLCQQHIAQTFEQALAKGRLGHAYIFAGAEGVGRFLMAKQWAKTLFCDDLPAQIQRAAQSNNPKSQAPQQTSPPSSQGEPIIDSCGVCKNCKLFETGNHPDFKHLYKEMIKFSKYPEKVNRAATSFSIDVVREFLVDQSPNSPQIAEKTVFVLDEAELMQEPAQNAMLKTLEEPPAHCLIILLCTRTERLLPTILSRAQVLRFAPVDENVIVERLAQNSVDKSQSLFWARFTSGSLGQSLMLSGLSQSYDCYEVNNQLLERIASMKLPDALDIAEWLVGVNGKLAKALEAVLEDSSAGSIKKRSQKLLLQILLSIGSDLVRLHISQPNALINSQAKASLEKLKGQIDIDNAAKYVDKCNSSIGWVDANVNERLIFEDNLINLAKLKT